MAIPFVWSTLRIRDDGFVISAPPSGRNPMGAVLYDPVAVEPSGQLSNGGLHIGQVGDRVEERYLVPRTGQRV
jgi:hypothetical protein